MKDIKIVIAEAKQALVGFDDPRGPCHYDSRALRAIIEDLLKALPTQPPTHSEMVKALVKPDADIFRTLIPGDCNAVHMAMGFASEVCEELFYPYWEALHLGTPLDKKNMIEEFGDAEFFLEGLVQEFFANKTDVTLLASTLPKEISSARQVQEYYLACLVMYSGHILDFVKRRVIYKKTPDINILATAIAGCLCTLSGLYKQLGITREQVLEANMDKVLKRYHEGGYSDAQANARADKDASVASC